MSPVATPSINPFLLATEAPPIPAAQAWTAAYRGDRGPLLNLSQAAPGDPPPPEFMERLAAAAGDPRTTRYGDIQGDEALRAALAADMTAVYGAGENGAGGSGADADVAAADLQITSGCNQAFFIALMALARAGDEILLPAPWYFNHKMMCDMLGVAVRPLPLDPAAGFLPDPEAAAAAIGPRTRAIVIVSPNNPTGATLPPERIAAFLDLARTRGVRLVLDETYRDFLPEGAGRPHGLFGVPDWRDHLVHLYSFSKSYAVPGHRVGALATGPALMGEIAKVQDCLQICAPRAAQAALAWAIPATRDWRAANRRTINARAASFRDQIAALDGWRIDQIGAYFAYLRHPFDRPSEQVAAALAAERGVLVLPGSWFGPGQERHLRVAFANVSEAALGGLAERMAGFEPRG